MNVEIFEEDCSSVADAASLKKLAEHVLREEGVGEGVELSLALVGPLKIKELNSVFLFRDEVTDVLAFPMEEMVENDDHFILGDVVICPEEVDVRKELYEIGEGDELAFVLIHGVLHLLGYDDLTEEGNQEMDRRAREILEKAKGLM